MHAAPVKQVKVIKAQTVKAVSRQGRFQAGQTGRVPCRQATKSFKQTQANVKTKKAISADKKTITSATKKLVAANAKVPRRSRATCPHLLRPLRSR